MLGSVSIMCKMLCETSPREIPIECNKPVLGEIKREILKKKNRLYYITHKEQINKNRKKYKRQTWSERKDNPKNL